MTQKEKDLLLKDLCAQLPYNLKVQYTTGDGMHIDCGVDIISIASECVGIFQLDTSRVVWCGVENIKPYLRPMSSMTKEELKEYINNLPTVWDTVCWLNAHHFDYRGLIDKSLALIAPEGMYKTE